MPLADDEDADFLTIRASLPGAELPPDEGDKPLPEGFALDNLEDALEALMGDYSSEEGEDVLIKDLREKYAASENNSDSDPGGGGGGGHFPDPPGPGGPPSPPPPAPPPALVGWAAIFDSVGCYEFFSKAYAFFCRDRSVIEVDFCPRGDSKKCVCVCVARA